MEFERMVMKVRLHLRVMKSSITPVRMNSRAKIRVSSYVHHLNRDTVVPLLVQEVRWGRQGTSSEPPELFHGMLLFPWGLFFFPRRIICLPSWVSLFEPLM